ncbi:MAG: selenide, water dikinase SelD [Cyanobacteria bacterium P01_E01_bin.6]
MAASGTDDSLKYMNVSPIPVTQTLVLIGGGHSHAIALKKWAMNPITGVRLILITDVVHTPYSGMLPGYVAGLYTYDQCHIDLRPLCQFGQVQLVRDRAIGLDLQNNTVICQNHPPVAFDHLSIDIGSTPSINQVPGVEQYAIPAKPISKFLAQWDAVLEQVRYESLSRLRVGVVGGGAGGVELALAIQGRLQAICNDPAQALQETEVHLFQRGDELLPRRHLQMRRTIHRVMHQKNIHLHLGETVKAVEASEFSAEMLAASSIGVDDIHTHPARGTVEYQVLCESGLTVPCDRLFWVTQASAAPWLNASGLATDEQGFIQVNDYLQSTSHHQVFAAGDIATMVSHPRPKAGVFAVRQGQPLYENLRRAVLKQPLQAFQPQKEFLILVGTGDESAIASRGMITVGPFRWLWNWKDRIDRVFMDQFTNLETLMGKGSSPNASSSSSPLSTPFASSIPSLSFPAMHCAGCASKVGRSVLDRVLHRLQQELPDAFQHPDVVLGLTDPDDASAITIHQRTTLIQTLDYFRALVDDPFIFGQIAANHCLSDVFAMGATPHSVLAIASLPYATERIHEETLYHLLSGSLKVLHQAGALLVGGHTVEGTELALGFSCNGFLETGSILKKGGMQVGDRLILTKALGTGTLFAANMQLKAKGRWIEGAIASMLQSNQAASLILQQHCATACTDVTGFGLLGHLLEMTHPSSSITVDLALGSLPFLDGAEDTIRQRLLSSLHPQNAQAFAQIQNAAELENHPMAPLLVDPQTSGGLLATVPIDKADDCVAELRQQGYSQSSMIGTVVPTDAGQKSVHVVVNG